MESPFARLYDSLFRDRSADCLANYSFIRHLQSFDKDNEQVILVARSTKSASESIRQHDQYSMRCRRLQLDSDAQSMSVILKSLILHEAASKDSEERLTRVLPLLSHFLSESAYDTSGRIESRDGFIYIMMILPPCPLGSFDKSLTNESERTHRAACTQDSEGKLRWIMLEVKKVLKECRKSGISIDCVELQDFVLWERKSETSKGSSQFVLVSPE